MHFNAYEHKVFRINPAPESGFGVYVLLFILLFWKTTSSFARIINSLFLRVLFEQSTSTFIVEFIKSLSSFFITLVHANFF